ncbi:MAG: cysteine--tRNA ligase [Parachlamydiales bacterium]|nr:cysteine--tRNA ligase [Parachlamydiales bacterium]
MLTLVLYHTELREKVPFSPQDGATVRLYTCGPTVYDFAHIGNFRTYVFEDILRRSLIFAGYGVNQVMNLTDVDDKTLKGAIAKNISLDAFTKPFIDAFFADLETLNIQKAEHYPAATQYIPDMIAMIEQLMEQGIAYKGADQSIYFSIKKFPDYGRLSHLCLEDLQVGASQRVAADEYDKEHASDFVLWKAYDPQRDGNIFWESPFGKGRPGWHIECSAMAIKLLGKTIDIHVGAVDNIFPHHENEIAQSEACTHQNFVKHWLHSEHLIVDGKKMSKSLGNFYTLRNLLDIGYTGREVRYMLLQTHYRTQLNFTMQGLNAAKSSLKRLDDFIDRLNGYADTAQGSCVFAERLHVSKKHFKAAIADDLNMPSALAVIFDLVREVNTICDDGKMTRIDAQSCLELLKRFDSILGVLFHDNEKEVPEEIMQLAKRRADARLAKDWKLADEMRQLISDKGYLIEDKQEGVRITKKG